MNPKNVDSVLAIGKNLDYVSFQLAISFAENGSYVWFISPEIFEKTPKNIKPPDKEVLQLITFMYLQDHNDLITHLNGLHLWRKTPTVIIVTRFEYYCNFNGPQYHVLQPAIVATSLLDSAAVCAKRHNEKVKLVAVSAEPTSPGDLHKLQVVRDIYFAKFVLHKDDADFLQTVFQLLE